MLFAETGNTKQGAGFRAWEEEMSSYFVTTEFKVPVGHSGVELSRKVWAEEKGRQGPKTGFWGAKLQSGTEDNVVHHRSLEKSMFSGGTGP